ncbi:hypothetical protein AALC25_12355 [Lachnospiraceae bacterium 29-84]
MAQEKDGKQEKAFVISLEEILEICEGAEGAKEIDSLEKLKDFFCQKKTKGLWLKDIIEAVGAPANIVSLAEKEKRIQWILDHVEIQGLKIPEQEKQEDHTEQIEAEGSVQPEAALRRPREDGKPCSFGLEEVNRFLSNLKDTQFEDKTGEIDIMDTKIYEGISVSYQDGFCVQYQPGFYEGIAVILKKSENVAVAVGYLQREEDKYHIVIEREKIDYQAFGTNRKYRLALFHETDAATFGNETLGKGDAIAFGGVVSVISCNIDYKQMERSVSTLCIDFGTSNTAAGSYGVLDREKNEIELVSFTDVTTPDKKESKLYPTIVYVEQCKSLDSMKLLYGYQAKKKVTDKGYDTEASVFFEIKRWIGSLDTEEEISDEDGNTLLVKRRVIVKSYILHVIDLAQQYFKQKFERLHLSAPVKLKEKFYTEMSGMLYEEGYIVLQTSSSVDEGIAIIYNSISRLIELDRIKENEKTSIMILDCGGGTTDLASCEVSAKDLDTGKKLEIATKFMNGNSNFGGNNITFRIMQLLKIKLASAYRPDLMQGCSLKELIPLDESEILSKVEGNFEAGQGRQYNSDRQNSIYVDFVEAYKKAEEIIPTVFQGNQAFQFAGQLKKIKRNYYYLWQLAEKTKIKFYEEDVVSVGFGTSENNLLEFDRTENNFLYVVEQGALVKKEISKEFEHQAGSTINDIRKVLIGDIYGLLNHLIVQEGFYVDRYQYYRLAGQSCKINLFIELLKEFIPGRNLRTNSSVKQEDAEEDGKGSIRLKLDCIKGSIAYIRDKECGKIKPEMKTEKPKMIYDVFVNKVNIEIPVLSKDDPNLLAYVPLPSKAVKAEFLVKNFFGEVERKIIVELQEEPREIKLPDIFEHVRSNGIASEETLDRLQDKLLREDPKKTDEKDYVRMVFAVPSNAGYGMTIYRIIKKVIDGKERYGWWSPIYENYENESAKSFFDGRR